MDSKFFSNIIIVLYLNKPQPFTEQGLLVLGTTKSCGPVFGLNFIQWSISSYEGTKFPPLVLFVIVPKISIEKIG